MFCLRQNACKYEQFRVSLDSVFDESICCNAALLVNAVCMCSFMLGYHVHEKAILVVTVPAAINAITDCRAAGNYLFLSTVGTYQLLPLLFTPTEYPIKVGSQMPGMRTTTPSHILAECTDACQGCMALCPCLRAELIARWLINSYSPHQSRELPVSGL